MISHSLVGFLVTFVATALALQKSEPTVRNGDDRNIEILGSATADLAFANITCQCCWRDCEDDPEMNDGTMVLESKLGAATSAMPAASGVDAWLIVTLRTNNEGFAKLEWNRYTPILETVKAAVESHGSVAQIVAFDQINDVIRAVRGAAAQGKRPLVFTVAHELSADVPYTISKLAEAKAAGGYLVAYQTEPAGADVDRFGTPKLLIKTQEFAAQIAADEVWDYTYAHVSYYPLKVGSSIVRYVPPGYVSALDVGIDVHKDGAQASAIGYMGTGKNTGMGPKYRRLLAGRMVETNSVWSNEDLRRYLEKYPLQLNMHRWQTCCPHDEWEDKYQHFETFRMSTLLANKACVISAPSAVKDMNLWKSMVTFVEVEDTLSAMEKLARNLTDCRVRSYETYKREFAPQKLLLESGFFNVWRPPHGN